MSERILTSPKTHTFRNSRQINIVLRQSETNHSTYANQPLHEQYCEFAKELDQLIGMEHVKEVVYEIYALLQMAQFRADAGLHAPAQVYHMVFKGNPGTGKTSVARLLAKMFHSMGVLSKGHLVEVERADLVGEYIGHTALKTRELVKKALGGMLFIDEAYSLARGGDKDFGKEAIDCLVKSMEDYRNQFVLILAGYPDEMAYFLNLNPGLPSRFPLIIDFQDYTVDQLLQIAEIMLKESQYVLMPQTELKLRQHLTHEKLSSGCGFSNGRYVRNLLEKSIRLQAVRILQQGTAIPSRQELMMLRPEDLFWEKRHLY